MAIAMLRARPSLVLLRTYRRRDLWVGLERELSSRNKLAVVNAPIYLHLHQQSEKDAGCIGVPARLHLAIRSGS